MMGNSQPDTIPFVRSGFLYLSSAVTKASSSCIYAGLYCSGVSASFQLNAGAGHRKVLSQRSVMALLSASAETDLSGD